MEYIGRLNYSCQCSVAQQRLSAWDDGKPEVGGMCVFEHMWISVVQRSQFPTLKKKKSVGFAQFLVPANPVHRLFTGPPCTQNKRTLCAFIIYSKLQTGRLCLFHDIFHKFTSSSLLNSVNHIQAKRG